MKEMVEVLTAKGWKPVLGNNLRRKLFKTDEADAMLSELNDQGVMARRKPVIPDHSRRGRVPLMPQDPTPEMAERWIKEMQDAGLDYHYDDDPKEVVSSGGRTFTNNEAAYLDDYCMDQLFNSLDDPFDVAMRLFDPDYDPEA